ncbi:uncharacterized protein LOC114687713 isoform X2 [Peromyscus leucopus]|uniref:uncharacterized protein LOC114687713 isoform X2 n=1 Tax=Peromyscus leucopus TaxID=10041 RepID=UPI0018859844|nr:uncharacterized protein LOC114687713 isoform X2 [Peromyscus leucopus]
MLKPRCPLRASGKRPPSTRASLTRTRRVTATRIFWALCRLPPVREEHEPPREEHTALRVLLPRVPFPVSHQLGAALDRANQAGDFPGQNLTVHLSAAPLEASAPSDLRPLTPAWVTHLHSVSTPQIKLWCC